MIFEIGLAALGKIWGIAVSRGNPPRRRGRRLGRGHHIQGNESHWTYRRIWLRVSTIPRLAPQIRVPTRARFSFRSPPLIPAASEHTPRRNPVAASTVLNGCQKNTTRLK